MIEPWRPWLENFVSWSTQPMPRFLVSVSTHDPRNGSPRRSCSPCSPLLSLEEYHIPPAFPGEYSIDISYLQSPVSTNFHAILASFLFSRLTLPIHVPCQTTLDVDGNVNEWNDKTAEITGFSGDEAFNQPLVETFIVPKLRPSVQEVLDNALKGVETSNYELEFRTKSNEIRYLLVNATTRRDAENNIVGVVGVAQVHLLLRLVLFL